MKEVVSQIIADVAENAAAVDSSASMPAIHEDGLSKVPEWSCQSHEESRGHDKSVLVHGQVMVNAMKQKVQGDAHAVIREIADEVSNY